MDIVEILRWRYATKKFDSLKKIPQKKIDIIKQSFNLTATSYGLQPVKLIIVEDTEIRKKLVEYSWNQTQVVEASHLLVFCTINKIDANYIRTYYQLIKKIRNTPDEILKPFEDFLIEDFDKKNKEEIEIWAAKQAYLAMGNLLTVCAVEQIDACPMEGFLPAKYDEILNLESQGLKSVLAMPIGYRANDDIFAEMKKVRKEVSESIIHL
ncbi:NAD(P)H-dependent oxidoreductase [Abyssalbus ytuae]|uniref:NAD(P)H-dependent oxidoreductase n=1 Tax=Abyssalbus ytuae TaxID=2926907 RepID=A0A9E6ZN58_9FLAO|nr:NAD(P)H-dependent oxidoreductase [Abyssalbus ytuae]UOB17764.1 NAD(P)H-dependent oxidoreductase [Abyssalbus ytuae]